MKLRYLIKRLRAYIGRGILVRQQVIIDSGQKQGVTTPIFVIGTHRSGTSLLRRILDSHSSIACPPESFFIEGYLDLHESNEYLNGFKALGFCGDMLQKVISNQASYYHESYMMAKGKSRWADKTPQYWRCLDRLTKLYNNNLQFVYIVRDPRDVAFSIYSRGWCLENDNDSSLEGVCRYVTSAICAQREFYESNIYICHVIDYGFLNDNPEKTLRPLFSFLGETWESSVMEHHKHKHDFGVEDPMVRGTRGFMRSAEGWKDLSANEQQLLHQFLKKALEDWQYLKTCTSVHT